ncbi:MAG: DNA-formamidopyrimidine glycosylase family protein [Gemmatimonadales bacterium]
MAEGHSVVRWARALGSLIGEPIVAADLPRRWSERTVSLPGQHVVSVATHGKHLLLHLSGGFTLHCHALMYGSWQFGRPGMQLRKPEKNVRVRLVTADREAVFFNGPVVELLTEEELVAHEKLNALGPDVLHEDFDRDEAWRRLQAQAIRAIGDAVLDQTLVAGIGNIFKSEGLFLASINPLAPVAAVSRGQLERFWDVLIPIMNQSARRAGPIVTLDKSLRRNGERHWVYRRTGRPCYRCGTLIEMFRQGQLKRTTYRCPGCQDRPVEQQGRLPL